MSVDQFHCPHCGALYERTDTKAVSRGDSSSVTCVVCKNIMHKLTEASAPAFKLIKRPENDTQ
jgi:hypothetical protein